MNGVARGETPCPACATPNGPAALSCESCGVEFTESAPRLGLRAVVVIIAGIFFAIVLPVAVLLVQKLAAH